MAVTVSLEWLGHQLHNYRSQREYEPDEYPPNTVDNLVEHLKSHLPGGFDDDLNRAYTIGGSGE